MISLPGGAMLKNFMIIAVFGLFIMAGCSGSRQSGSSESMSDTDAAVQERIADLLEKIDDEPNNIQWRMDLANEYRANGKNMDALKTYEQALALDPSRSDVKFEYAQLALQMGDKRKAFQAYKEILQGLNGEQFLGRIAPMFVDTYKVKPVISSMVPEAFGCYSPDGSRILYQSYTGSNWDIFEYDRVSEQNIQITNNPADEENPVYSPTAPVIAYTSTRDDHRDVDYNQKLRDIYIMDLKSKSETNLTTNSSNDWKPRYSPNGKFIVFVSERDDLRDVDLLELYCNIYIMEDDGSFQLRLTHADANDGGPIMTGGENDPIFFDSNRGGNFDIYRLADKKVERITYNDESNDVAPDISPDGSKIVFFSDRDGNYEIYMMNTDGSNQQRLTSNLADDTNPVFSPDGKKVLFQSNRSGNWDIYEMDLELKNDTPAIYEVVDIIDQNLSNM